MLALDKKYSRLVVEKLKVTFVQQHQQVRIVIKEDYFEAQVKYHVVSLPLTTDSDRYLDFTYWFIEQFYFHQKKKQ